MCVIGLGGVIHFEQKPRRLDRRPGEKHGNLREGRPTKPDCYESSEGGFFLVTVSLLSGQVV